MQRRLVKTIRATQVTSVGHRMPEPVLSVSERQSLADVADRYGEVIALRSAGLSPSEISRLAFVKWRRATGS